MEVLVFAAVLIASDTFFLVMATLPLVMREVRSGRRAGCGGRPPHAHWQPRPTDPFNAFYDVVPMAPWQPPEWALVVGWAAAYVTHALLTWTLLAAARWPALAVAQIVLWLQALWVVLFYWAHAHDLALVLRAFVVAGSAAVAVLATGGAGDGVPVAAVAGVAWTSWLAFVFSLDVYTQVSLCRAARRERLAAAAAEPLVPLASSARLN